MRTFLVADVADVSASSDDYGRGAAGGALGGGADQPSDERLVERVANADASALGALYDRHGVLAYSLALRICGERSRAEDVVREIFRALWRDPQLFDPRRGGLPGWLLTQVQHRSVELVRQSGRPPESMDLQADWWEGRPGQGVPGADEVRAALRLLPSDQGRTLALAFFGGYTQQEVAAITGVPLDTVKSRMFDSVQRLRALLMPRQWDSGRTLGQPR
ncbi:MAG TPA: sigma factor [Pseudonocardia sp.]